MTMNFRNNFSRLAQKLIQNNEYNKAKKVLDYCMQIMPGDKIDLNYFVHPIIQSYYTINDIQTANQLVESLRQIYASELTYYFTFFRRKQNNGGVNRNITQSTVYNELIELATKNNYPSALEMKQEFEQFYRNYLML